MMDRPRSAAWDCLLLACAAWASGCGARGNSSSDLPAPVFEKVDWRKIETEPRHLAEVAPVGFRSRSKTPSSYSPPEISLGAPADDQASTDAAANAAPARQSWDDLDAEFEAFSATDGAPRSGPEQSEPLAAEPPVAHDGRGAATAADQVPEQGASPAEAWPQTPLPWAQRGARSAEMDAVAHRADQLVQQGFRLAERGAVYSARDQFVEAVGLIAQTLDLQHRTQAFGESLAAGRTALAEARDFSSHGAAAPLNLPRIVAAHRTPVLRSEQLEQLSPIVAQQRYYTYAQEQLALAAGEEPAGSLALYGLGKTTAQAQVGRAAAAMSLAGEQAAYYQAALLADPRNFRAASELGVVLAEFGRNDAARELFLRSLAIAPQAATWQNLAVVHGRLGETTLADQALAQSRQLRNTKLGEITGDNLRWVDPETFARSLPAGEAPLTATRPAEVQPPAEPSSAQPPASARKRTAMRLPWNKR